METFLFFIGLMSGQRKRCKSRRSFFDRRKNDIRKQQAQHRELEVVLPPSADENGLKATSKGVPNCVEKAPLSTSHEKPARESSENGRAILVPITNTVESTNNHTGVSVLHQSDSSLLQRHHPNAPFEVLKEEIQPSLLEGWTLMPAFNFA